MIEIHDNIALLNYAEAILGELRHDNDQLIVPCERLHVMDGVTDAFLVDKVGEFLGLMYIVYEGVKNFTVDYEKSCLLNAETRTCVGGRIFNSGNDFECWFEYSVAHIYLFEESEVLKNKFFEGLFIENYAQGKVCSPC